MPPTCLGFGTVSGGMTLYMKVTKVGSLHEETKGERWGVGWESGTAEMEMVSCLICVVYSCMEHIFTLGIVSIRVQVSLATCWLLMTLRCPSNSWKTKKNLKKKTQHHKNLCNQSLCIAIFVSIILTWISNLRLLISKSMSYFLLG